MDNIKGQVIELCDKHYHQLFEKPNVIGVAFGTKIKNGIDTKRPCISVLTTKKVASEALYSEHLIPETYFSIPTDVIEIGEINAMALVQRVRPMVFGYSIGPSGQNMAGTSGCLVTNGSNYFVLSNNHVLARENKTPLYWPIIQPAGLDGGKLYKDSIGFLYRYAKLLFENDNPNASNYIDAAIAQVTFKNTVTNQIFKVGKVKGTASAMLNMPVKKSGRTTEYTTGKVISTNATIRVNYSDNKVGLFKNQIVTSGMSSAGDSGSLLCDMDNNAVGLLFAGSNAATIHNPIKRVLDEFKVKIVTG